MSISIRAGQGRSSLRLVLFLFAALLPLAIGCQTQKAWQYSPEPESPEPIVSSRSVAVPPFVDRRVNENSNLTLLYMIPLMPFGWQHLQTPEGAQVHMTSGLWLWRPDEDMAKAAATELRSAHIFREVFFTNRQSEGDLVLQGTINSSDYRSKLISYGLSVYGPLLWFFGFPACYASNKLDVKLAIKDPGANKVIWTKSYQREVGKISWIYYLRSDFDYPDFLKDILLEATDEIRTAAVTFDQGESAPPRAPPRPRSKSASKPKEDR